MLDEHDIIVQLQRGDEKAFRFIFDHEYVGMCRFANGMLHDRAAAEGIVGDVIYNLWENHADLNITQSLHAYLFASVRNRCLNELKQRLNRMSLEISGMNLPHELELLDIIFKDDRQPLGIMIEKELEEKILEAIGRLPDECRTVFRKSRMDGKQYAEIAEELGISVNTVKYHIKNAIAFLHKNLDDYLKFIILAMIIR